MKALVGAFNKEKALVGAFSVIVKTECETDGDGSYAALLYSGVHTWILRVFGLNRSQQTESIIHVLHEIHLLGIYQQKIPFSHHMSLIVDQPQLRAI